MNKLKLIFTAMFSMLIVRALPPDGQDLPTRADPCALGLYTFECLVRQGFDASLAIGGTTITHEPARPAEVAIHDLIENPVVKAAISSGELSVEGNDRHASIECNGSAFKVRLDGSMVYLVNGYSWKKSRSIDDVLLMILYASRNRGGELDKTIIDLGYVFDIAEGEPISVHVDNNFPFLPHNGFDFYEGFADFCLKNRVFNEIEYDRVKKFFSVGRKIADILLQLRQERKRTLVGSFLLKAAEVVPELERETDEINENIKRRLNELRHREDSGEVLSRLERLNRARLVIYNLSRNLLKFTLKMWKAKELHEDPNHFFRNLDPTTLLELNDMFRYRTYPEAYCVLAQKVYAELPEEKPEEKPEEEAEEERKKSAKLQSSFWE